ncbi:MAG: diguanylate cyclase [Solirubrobacterales bacterium]|nr:diguanylate cyclase [Solirubrobacterales bacterium]
MNLPTPPGVSAFSPRAALRFVAVLHLAGCGLGLASMLLPQPVGQDDWKIYVVLAATFLVGAGLLVPRSRDRDPQLLLFLSLAASTVLITAGIHASGRMTSVYAMFYVGMAPVAFSSLGRRAALTQVALVALAYGALMLHDPPAGAAERWLVTVGTVLGVGLIVGVMRRRVERLLAELSASAERLAEAACTDPLTGLMNRRGFEERVTHELARMRRGGATSTLVLCDLDRFKDVNDLLGHPAGDAVLRRVADVARDRSRGGDVIARLGGAEFGLLLPATDEAGALEVAERLRRAIARACAADGISLTSSAGIAVAAEHPTVTELMRAGDAALHAAKALGRDRTVTHRPHLAALLPGESDPGAGELSPLRTTLALSEALDLRDPYTADHSRTVAAYAQAMARDLGFTPRGAARMHLAGLLHDVGKIGVSDAVLRKAGPLDAAEWDEMRTHPAIGARLIGPVASDIAEWVLAHHERIDGGGYPRGLAGDAIPLEARILAAADAFEAMTSDRPYRRALPRELAIAQLRKHAGTQFDARVVEVFVRALGAPTDDELAVGT